MPLLAILLSSILPLGVKLAENAISGDNKGSEKKQWVLDLLGDLYDKWDSADGKTGDEWLSKTIVLEVAAVMIDLVVKKVINKE